MKKTTTAIFIALTALIATPTHATQTDEWTDVTNLVTNPTCTENTGWEKAATNASATYNVSNSILNSDDYDGDGIEYWTPTTNPTTSTDLIYQDITGLPQGTYLLTAYAMARNQTTTDQPCDPNGICLFAGTDRTPVTTNTWQTYTLQTTTTNDTLRIGLTATTTNTNNWVALAGVTLQYNGTTLDFNLQTLQTKVQQAHTLAQTLQGRVPTTYTQQLSQIQAADCSTIEECQTAIALIDTLIQQTQKIQTTFYNIYMALDDYARNTIPQILDTDTQTLQNFITIADTCLQTALSTTQQTTWQQAATTLAAACKNLYTQSNGLKDGTTQADVTPLFVNNPGFNHTDPVEGWTGLTSTEVTDGILVKTSAYTWDFNQTITVPRGIYTLSAQMTNALSDRYYLYLYSNYQTTQYLFKWTGSGTTAEIAQTWLEDTQSCRLTTEQIIVLDSTLTLGANCFKANTGGNMHIDNFRLTYISDATDEIIQLYTDALQTAQELAQQTTLPDTFVQNLNQAIQLPAQTTDQMLQAYQTLNTLNRQYQPILETCNQIATLIEQCTDYTQNATADDETLQTLQQTIQEATTYRTLTTTQQLTTLYETLTQARNNFVATATPDQDYEFDMTHLLTNPDVMGWNAYTTPDGWYTDIDCTIFQVQQNSNMAGQTNPECWEFVETWSADVLQQADGNGWLIYQIATLPAGSYRLQAYTFGADPGNNDTNITDTPSAALCTGTGTTVNTRGDSITGTVMTLTHLTFVNATEANVKLGIYINPDNDCSWFGINNMQLYKTHPQTTTLILDETTEFPLSTDTYADVTLTRHLTPDTWNTLCLPFSLSSEQIEQNSLGEVRELTSVSQQSTTVTLRFDTVEEITAGIPYIVRPETEINLITATDVAVLGSEPDPYEFNIITLHPTYSPTTVPQGMYAPDGDVFTRVAAAEQTTLNGYRFYADLYNSTEQTTRLLLQIDGQVTDVTLTPDKTELPVATVDVYSLSGVRLRSGVPASEALQGLKSGIYIVGKEKVIVP